MRRESWFNPEDKSQSVIRPELQDKSSNDLPSNLLAVYTQILFKDNTNQEEKNDETFPLR